MTKKRITSMLALLLALMIVLTGCTGSTTVSDTPESSEPVSEAEPSSEAAPEDDASSETEGETETSDTATGGTLRIGDYVLDTQLANKSPFATSGTWNFLMGVIYEPLMTYNVKQGKLEPALANEYSWNEEMTELTFTLNTDAKWHDGTDFTADDVVCTMNILKDYPAFDKYALWDKISEVAADGADTVVFKTSVPFVSLPQYMSDVKIAPKHIWENVDPETEVNENPVGTGPFSYVEYTVGTSVLLTAFEDYWGGAPKVDELLLVMYNSSPNCTLGLLNGEIEATPGTLSMSTIPELLAQEYANLDIYTGLGNYSVIMNHENELLADPAVRKAMAMAIDQETLISRGEYNGVLPTSIAWLPDLFGDYVNQEAAATLTYDIEAAKAVLEEAGYTKGDDGIYQKDGKRLSFTYHNASGAPAQQMEAGMIQQWLLNLGVEIIPKLATWPELTTLLQNGDFDLLQNGISFPADPYAAINSCFNSSMTAPTGETTPGLNYFRYRSDEMDALLEQAASETDEEVLKDLYYQMQDILAKDYVFLPMYNSSGHVPYFDGRSFTGWTDYDAPVISNRNLINVRPVS